MKKKQNKIDKRKTIVEIVVVPICLFYLIYTYIGKIEVLNTVLLYLVIAITCAEFIYKYGKEVYVYENKYNYLKTTYIIFSALLLILLILSLIIKKNIIKTIFVTFIIIMLVYLLYYGIKHIIKIVRNKGTISSNTISAFSALVSFCSILASLIVYLK